MPESLFKKKAEPRTEEPADSSAAKDVLPALPQPQPAPRELEARSPAESELCALIKAYFVVKEVSKEAAEVLKQEIIKKL